MSVISLKGYYSVYQLADLKLKSLPKTAKNIWEKAKRENWQSRKREGKGGGVEYALTSLPAEVQAELHGRFALANIANPKTDLVAARANLDVHKLTSKQTAIVGNGEDFGRHLENQR